MSHAGLGWEEFTRALLSQVPKTVPVLAWGREAGLVADEVWGKYAHNVIRTSHPCKYSARRGESPFIGSDCFRKVPGIRWGGYRYNA